MTNIQIIDTADGSNTLYSEKFNAHYHSLNGALQESRHIFIDKGYKFLSKNQITILEVGLGASLNASLTAAAAEISMIKTDYTGIELIPLEKEILDKINFKTVISDKEFDLWQKINQAPWGQKSIITDYFTIEKLNIDFTSAILTKTFDICYFDAFAPEDQPEMWSNDIFKKIYDATAYEGILITYCSKGIVKQTLRNVGYKVERLPGPIGKRHIIRAIKTTKK